MRHSLAVLSSYVPAAAVALSLALASSCTPAGADPAGPTTSEVRSVGDFHAIELAGVIAIEARIDATTRVEVVGEADKIKKVKTSVKDGVLVVDTERSLKKARHLRVLVSAPSLDGLTISGTGELTATGLSGRLDATISGTGALKLDGKAPSLRMTVNGTGKVDAKDLVASKAAVEVAGTGSITVHATKELDISISGTGSVNVHGNPGSVKKSVTGTGSINIR